MGLFQRSLYPIYVLGYTKKHISLYFFEKTLNTWESVMPEKIRVRFAPSPTGSMHLGNIRTALLNYLFAKQRNGALILRIEDTDQARNVDLADLKILKDLEWLGIACDEGPFLQSERTHLYQEHLDDLIANGFVYRCFCTPEILKEKRKEQIEKKKPPRYDRTCLHLSDDHIKQKLVAKKPFIWRFKVNSDQAFTIKSMARKKLSFDMKNFSDFALTRSDGSFTFLFSNFVDDWLMEISHVIRGEDHLSNTAMQAALFDALAVDTPTFWHLPMMINKEGKKLSKRDFGFALDDLKSEGFLPQAICNYLAIIGGSFKDEIQSLEELAHSFDFDNIHTTGAIRYDVEKLRWVNHKWIERLDAKEILPFIVPLSFDTFPCAKATGNTPAVASLWPARQDERACIEGCCPVSEEKLLYLVSKVKNDCSVLKDFVDALRFCFEDPEIDISVIDEKIGKDKTNSVASLIDDVISYVPKSDLFIEHVKREGKEKGLKPKEFFGVIRYLLTGSFEGISVHDIIDMLSEEQAISRLKKL